MWMAERNAARARQGWVIAAHIHSATLRTQSLSRPLPERPEDVTGGRTRASQVIAGSSAPQPASQLVGQTTCRADVPARSRTSLRRRGDS